MSHNLITNVGNHQNYGSMGGPQPPPEVTFAGFSPTEFYNLCENITTNIYTINSSWKNLEKAVKCIGTNKDNQGFRDNIHVSQLSTNQIISVTTKDLQRLTMVVRRGDKQQKLQVEKLTSDFKEAVATYSKLQQQVVEKMKANFLPTALSLENSGNFEANEDSDADSQARRFHAQAQLSRDLAFEREMLLERESRVRQIEADVLDVNQIMRELGAMIYQQGESIDTIENSIDQGVGNVEEGTAQLVKAASYQSKYRRKLCLLVFVAAVAVAVLIGVIVWDLKR